MQIPLHLPQLTFNDTEADALKRVQLHIFMSGVTRGKGFRTPGKNSRPTRIELISETYFGGDSV